MRDFSYRYITFNKKHPKKENKANYANIKDGYVQEQLKNINISE